MVALSRAQRSGAAEDNDDYDNDEDDDDDDDDDDGAGNRNSCSSKAGSLWGMAHAPKSSMHTWMRC